MISASAPVPRRTGARASSPRCSSRQAGPAAASPRCAVLGRLAAPGGAPASGPARAWDAATRQRASRGRSSRPCRGAWPSRRCWSISSGPARSRSPSTCATSSAMARAAMASRGKPTGRRPMPPTSKPSRSAAPTTGIISASSSRPRMARNWKTCAHIPGTSWAAWRPTWARGWNGWRSIIGTPTTRIPT